MAERIRTQWKNHSRFLAVSTTMMRRILVNHGLARRAAKRDVERVALTLSGLAQLAKARKRGRVAVHEPLLVFEKVDARTASVVALRFVDVLENGEIAAVLGSSLATVKCDGRLACAWLQRGAAAPRRLDLTGGRAHGPSVC